MRRQRGFTLMELMIAVAIVGILASIAYPAYSEYVRKARRADAQAYLKDIALRQEQYLIDARSYGTLAQLRADSPPAHVSTYYTISIPTLTAGPPPTYMAQAAPTTAGGQNKDKCGTMTIDNTGVKTPTECW